MGILPWLCGAELLHGFCCLGLRLAVNVKALTGKILHKELQLSDFVLFPILLQDRVGSTNRTQQAQTASKTEVGFKLQGDGRHWPGLRPTKPGMPARLALEKLCLKTSSTFTGTRLAV